MKKAIILFWHGLTGIFSSISNWFTVILGMRDDSVYGRIIRRIVGGSFALLVLIMTTTIGWCWFHEICNQWSVRHGSKNDERYYSVQYLSPNTLFYDHKYSKEGYVKDRDGKKILENVRWIAKPLGRDSLVCYSDGKRRGYFNMYTGENVIQPQYHHAWVFSDGLASVDDGGWIKFIDPTGNVVVDTHLPYISGMDGYVFHEGLCVVRDMQQDKVGLLDKTGKWLLQPEYQDIYRFDSLLIISNGTEEAVMTTGMETIIPFSKANHWIENHIIQTTMPDHTLRQYDLRGNVIADFYISEVERMTYPTSELCYNTTKYYDNNGNVTKSETDNYDPYFTRRTANRLCYQAEAGWYGLMSNDGHVITPPSYTSITAIGPDLYLCKLSEDYGILLNGKGQQVK